MAKSNSKKAYSEEAERYNNSNSAARSRSAAVPVRDTTANLPSWMRGGSSDAPF